MNQSDPRQPPAEAPRSRPFGWSLATLLMGVLALAGAVMLHLNVDEPQPQRTAAAESDPPAEQADGGVRLRWKKINLRISSKVVVEPPPKVAPPPEDRPDVGKPLRQIRMAIASVALLGLTLGPVAFWRESIYPLSGSGMVFCFLALTWQYILAGLVVGVAIAVLLLILSSLP